MEVLLLPAVVLAVSTLPGWRPTLENLLASVPAVMLALLPGQRPALEGTPVLVPASKPMMALPKPRLATEPAVL